MSAYRSNAPPPPDPTCDECGRKLSLVLGGNVCEWCTAERTRSLEQARRKREARVRSAGKLAAVWAGALAVVVLLYSLASYAWAWRAPHADCARSHVEHRTCTTCTTHAISEALFTASNATRPSRPSRSATPSPRAVRTAGPVVVVPVHSPARTTTCTEYDCPEEICDERYHAAPAVVLVRAAFDGGVP